jgi:hypothetical protein
MQQISDELQTILCVEMVGGFCPFLLGAFLATKRAREELADL